MSRRASSLVPGVGVVLRAVVGVLAGVAVAVRRRLLLEHLRRLQRRSLVGRRRVGHDRPLDISPRGWSPLETGCRRVRCVLALASLSVGWV